MTERRYELKFDPALELTCNLRIQNALKATLGSSQIDIFFYFFN